MKYLQQHSFCFKNFETFLIIEHKVRYIIYISIKLYKNIARVPVLVMRYKLLCTYKLLTNYYQYNTRKQFV